jgi:hypothetical protein
VNRRAPGLVFAVVLVGGGCGHHGSTSITPTPNGPGSAAAALPSGPPFVTPGERMVYKIELRGLELAQMTLGVGDIAEVAGKKAIVVQGHAKSVGLANLVAAVDDTFTSWIDTSTGRTLRFSVDEFATNSKTDIEHTAIDIAGRTGNSIPIQFHLNDEAPKDEPQTAGLPEVWDYNAFLVMLRAWEGPKDTAAGVEVFRSRYLWHVDMKIGAKGKLTTALGDFPALRFDGHAVKLARDHTKYPDTDERDFSVWISDDDGRVPLQLVAKTDYGEVKMTITDYQPGNGTRLR